MSVVMRVLGCLPRFQSGNGTRQLFKQLIHLPVVPQEERGYGRREDSVTRKLLTTYITLDICHRHAA
jgi:hypothetical protein